MAFRRPQDGTKLELDAWSIGQPKAGPLRPAVVFLHGGGWVVGNRSARPDWNRRLAIERARPRGLLRRSTIGRAPGGIAEQWVLVVRMAELVRAR